MNFIYSFMNHDQPFFDNRISFILAFIAKVRNPL